MEELCVDEQVVICELIFPFHDAAIAEAGEGKKSICKAYIINKMFFKCIQGAPTRLQTRPLKMRPAAGIRGGGSGMIRELSWGGSSSLSLSLTLPLIF